ncbi:Hypothetical predicted protein [Pelobates cultripes]|uniref:Uncharacterized protein n=1 Tax=Pelobates cultripes TaxID=61616 RepID=A0AAD1SYV0_PELCU|nr:Hypothetical predicted protein [Pelobates cultripes]
MNLFRISSSKQFFQVKDPFFPGVAVHGTSVREELLCELGVQTIQNHSQSLTRRYWKRNKHNPVRSKLLIYIIETVHSQLEEQEIVEMTDTWKTGTQSIVDQTREI